MTYSIEIKNVGKELEFFQVFDVNGIRRRACFFNRIDAQEACSIIKMLRTDSAFEYVRVKPNNSK